MFVQKEAVEQYTRQGIVKDQLLISIPTYGRSFTLTTNDTGLDAPSLPSQLTGPSSQTDGYLTYYEVSVCNLPLSDIKFYYYYFFVSTLPCYLDPVHK